MRARESGLSMIEVSILLLVMGVVLIVLMRPLGATIRQAKIEESRAAVKAAKDGVMGYAMAHGVLPRTLSQASHTRDAWGREMLYLHPAQLSTENYCSTPAQSLDHTLHGSGGPGEDVLHVAFLVASTGADRRSGITGSGSSIDIGEAGDDIVEYVTLYELKGALCP